MVKRRANLTLPERGGDQLVKIVETVKMDEDLQTTALDLWKLYLETGEMVDKEVAVSLVYLASRLVNKPYPIKVIARLAGIRYNNIMKTLNKVSKKFHLRLRPLKEEDYIHYLSKNLDEEVMSKVVYNMKKLKESMKASPLVIVACSLLLSLQQCNRKYSVKEVTNLLGLAETTIRKRCSKR